MNLTRILLFFGIVLISSGIIWKCTPVETDDSEKVENVSITEKINIPGLKGLEVEKSPDGNYLLPKSAFYKLMFTPEEDLENIIFQEGLIIPEKIPLLTLCNKASLASGKCRIIFKVNKEKPFITAECSCSPEFEIIEPNTIKKECGSEEFPYPSFGILKYSCLACKDSEGKASKCKLKIITKQEVYPESAPVSGTKPSFWGKCECQN